MADKLWDLLVDTMIVLFMPLVCSYFSISGNLFYNVSIRHADGLEQVGNTLLTPLQYLLDGREAVEKPDGSWEFVQRFDYKQGFWFKTAASLFSLPSSVFFGTMVKGLSFFSEETRNRYAALESARNSTKIYPHLEEYRKLGLGVDEIGALQAPQGYQRRPGDENVLAAEKQALRDITALLNEAKILWWVDCGTCLGAYRYGGAIPWDEDVDIAVLLNDFQNVRNILNKLDRKKYLVQDWSTRDFPDSFIKVYIRETRVGIDIYHFSIAPETRELRYVFSLENTLFFPEWFKIREGRFKAPVAFDTVFPLKKALFDGIEVFIPNDTKKYLQRCYGENLAPVKVYDPKTGCYEKDLSHPYWQKAYVH